MEDVTVPMVAVWYSTTFVLRRRFLFGRLSFSTVLLLDFDESLSVQYVFYFAYRHSVVGNNAIIMAAASCYTTRI